VLVVFNFHQIERAPGPQRPNPDVRGLSSATFASYKRRVTRLLVALLLGLAMPVAQLSLVHVERWCCCPDRTKCHCPHDDDQPQSSMKSCHETERVVTSSPMAAFAPPVLAASDVAAPVARVIEHAISEPHAPPAPRRPDAPS
jgi:hypothetical protein